ncbi:MAG: arsenite methyltransferase [Thermodesulfobacteriota bacterium]
MKTEEIKKEVRDRYARVVTEKISCCAPASSCCGPALQPEIIGKYVGYSDQDLQSVPEGANLGLGCGNPLAHAALKPGDTVIDLGSGAGFDCFLAARQVGPQGRVIGVDMTAEMIDAARKNAEKGGYTNVEFRLGEIENLPLADNQGDMIISNCVINLAPDKARVFQEAFRVLKPGGRLMVSDIVLLGDLPKEILESIPAYVSCVAGAVKKGEYLKAMEQAGFREVAVLEETVFELDKMINDPTIQPILAEGKIERTKANKIDQLVASIKVSGFKPLP